MKPPRSPTTNPVAGDHALSCLATGGVYVAGGIAARLADHVVLTSDNPRSEDPQAIIEEIVAGVVADVDVDRQEDTVAVVGRDGESLVASDVSAIVSRTQNVVYLKDGEIAHLTQFFIDRGTQRGLVVETFKLFEDDLNKIRKLPLPAAHQTGSTGRALTLVLMRGSTMSPEISSRSSAQYSDTCSGAWPTPTATSVRLAISRSFAMILAR